MNVDNKNSPTVVLDAGGRYGIHPSWKPFTGDLLYFIFEPDGEECKRLKKKYKSKKDKVHVVRCALSDKKEKLVLNYFQNKAMSSVFKRNPVSPLFTEGSGRESEVLITSSESIKATTIDLFCSEKNICLDFLKLDTEGGEFAILMGAINQLQNHLLGLRCEVSFDSVFEGAAGFSAIHELMLSNNFILINLDYDGRGDYQNKFVNVGGKYGILSTTDAVWMLRPEYFLSNLNTNNKNLGVSVMKYSAFALLNSAQDLALKILVSAVE
jgi:FkbM family methyltransferase